MAIPRDSRARGLQAEALPLPTVSTTLMAGFGAALFAAGGGLGLITVALPHVGDMNEVGVAGASVGAILVALGLFLARERINLRGLEAVIAFGTFLISTAMYYAGSVTTSFAFFYLWVALYSAYFFGHARAALQIAVVALAYALVLVTKPGVEGAVESWVAAVGTLVMAAALFGYLRDRVTSLVDQLGEAATTDTLTGLVNRRGFATQFELELKRAGRSNEPFGLIVGDLDHFKAVNDRFGHQAGDEVLAAVGRVLRSRVRTIDTVARIGGEEFALLLPSTDSQGAFMLAESLRAAVHEEPACRGLTISFGVTSYPTDGRSVEALLRRGDESLYAAKTLGRDRTVIYSEEVVGTMAGDQPGGPASNLATLLTLAEALDIRDARTAKHSATVGRYAEAMARQLGLDPARVERIRLAGVLHDIGKIGVADSVLHKPGPLDHDEWTEIRKHPEVGARLLSMPGLEDLRGWVLAHHERIDGRGYPHRLRGQQIPLEARIIAVADAFEAMTSDRPYSRGMSERAALDELDRNAGTQFDAAVVAALREVPALGRDSAVDR